MNAAAVYTKVSSFFCYIFPIASRILLCYAFVVYKLYARRGVMGWHQGTERNKPTVK